MGPLSRANLGPSGITTSGFRRRTRKKEGSIKVDGETIDWGQELPAFHAQDESWAKVRREERI